MQKLLLLLCLLPLSLFGQKKTFYNKFQEPVDSAKGFSYYQIVEKQPGGLMYVREFLPNDSLLTEGTYSVYKHRSQSNIKEGLHKYYHRTGGVLWYTENYKADKLDGERVSYYRGGQLKRRETYVQDSMLSGLCYNEDGSARPFTQFQRQPEYPGGEPALFKYISDNMVYPKLALENGIQGSVVTTFVVNKDGSVSDVTVLKDIGAGCGTEAARLIQGMSQWTPGYADDEPVKVRYTLPLKFKLESGRKKKKRKKD
jgi:protein TonB